VVTTGRVELTSGPAVGWPRWHPATVAASTPSRATSRPRAGRFITIAERTRVGIMVKRLKVSLLIVVVASLGFSAGGAFAQAKSETITETIPKSTAKFDLVKLPAGKVKVNGKEVDVKPVWIGKTEVTWDEYDIYWQRLDLTAEEVRAGADADNRPSKPYSPPDRGFGR